MTSGQPDAPFPFERLRVFREAHEFALACHVATKGDLGRRDLVSQLRRASASIACNIAEGAGETRPREKARIYRIARRSGTECLALLGLMRDLQTVSAMSYAELRKQLGFLLWLLTRLIDTMESRES